MPCPDWVSRFSSPCTPSASHEVTLTTAATDPNDDHLLYSYVASGGKINGHGPRASWDYYGLMPGSYTAKVVISDQHGGSASASVKIVVAVCTACDRFCPNLSISCPENVEEGQSFVLSVSVSGGDPELIPGYKWSLSSGTIVKGQGTPTIEVVTSGLAAEQLKATVEVDGVPPECQRVSSCEVQIRKKD
jgi:hypothetical protein